MGLEPRTAIGTDVPITQTKTGPYTKKNCESDLKNNHIKSKAADLTITASRSCAQTCVAHGEGGQYLAKLGLEARTLTWTHDP
jgi:hypothetical protein